MLSSPKAKSGLLLLLLTYAAYISLGLPDGLMGAAWPQMRSDLGVSLNANWPIYISGLMGGLLSGIFAGAILCRISVGQLLLLTTVITSASIAGCGLCPWYWPIVGIGFLLGLGNSAIDVGLNHFVATHFTSRHMNWLHACWGVGVSTGTLIISGVANLGSSWRTACLLIASLQGLLALTFLFSQKLWNSPPTLASPEGQTRIDNDTPAPTLQSLRQPISWISLGCFFLYCGVEFSSGVWTTSLLQSGRGWHADRAALMVTLYWASLTVGRFMIGIISNRLRPIRILRLAISGAIVGTLLISLSSVVSHTLSSGLLTAAGLLLMGFSLAPIYPTMMHDTPACVGRSHAVNLIGLQAAAANVGLTMVPGILGTFMKHSSLEYLGPCLVFMACALLFMVHLREKHRLSPSA
jgi:fucose permease